MKKYLTIQKKREHFLHKWLSLISFIIVFNCFLSCNNESKQSEVTDSTKTDSGAIKMPDQDAMKADAFNGNFPALTISKEDLELFFAPPQTQKLVFRFQFDDGSSQPSLVAFKATSVRVYDPTPLIPRLAKEPYARNLTGELFLGNLEMSRTKFENLKRLPSYSTATHLLFAAKKKVINVTYELEWIVKAGFTAAALDKIVFIDENDLNPSPPDPPAGSN